MRSFFLNFQNIALPSGLAIKLLIIACFAITLGNSLFSLVFSIGKENLFLFIALCALVLTGVGMISEYTFSGIICITTLLLPMKSRLLVLSGFTSMNIYIVLSFFIVALIIQQSKIFQRIAILLLLKYSSKPTYIEKWLFLLGILMTPILSVQSTRVAIIAPILDDIVSNSGYQPQSDAANGMANAAFTGCILLSTVFLSGKSSNYLLFSFMSLQNNLSNSWLLWLSFAAFPGALLIGAFFLIQSISYKTPSPVRTTNRFTLLRSHYQLGAFSPKEQAAIISSAVLIGGLLLGKFLPVHPLFIAISTALISISSGLLNSKTLINNINWKFIGYLGTMIGLMKFINSITLPVWIMNLHTFLYPVSGNIYLFIFIIFLSSWLLCMLFGTMIAPGLAFTLLTPLLSGNYVNQWVIAFVILMATESWIFSYQSSYFICFKNLLNNNQNFQFKPLLITNAWLALVKLGVIFASIPYWHLLGLV